MFNLMLGQIALAVVAVDSPCKDDCLEVECRRAFRQE